MNNLIKIVCVVLAAAVFCAPDSSSQTPGPLPRVDFGARLDLPGMIYDGAGQDPAGFKNYFGLMPGNLKPALFTCYFQLKDLTPADFERLAQDLNYYQTKYNVYLIPQIGLSMTYGLANGEGNLCYDKDVAAGLYDDKIELLCRLLDGLGHPAFLRIGVEFNGLDFYGYTPEPFVKAFRKITDAVRRYRLEAATVWNAAYIRRQGKGFTLDNSRYSYMRYYPGDEYVDWWGLSLFLPEVFNSRPTREFLDNAAAHKKPVMIAETTPLRIGTTGGQRDWDAWFAPYFTFINTHPMVKALCYINWNWAAKSTEYSLPWGDWGDCRLEANKVVAGLYQGQMSGPLYFHGRGEKEFRRALGVNDSLPPGRVSELKALFKTYNVLVSWSPADDNTGIARYEVYRGNTFLGSTIQHSFTDSNLKAGSVSTYAVKAVDMGGNTGREAYSGKVALPLSIEKVGGGDFESADREWAVRTWSGGEMSFSRDTGAPLSGQASAKLYVKQGTGTNWHVQFSHYLTSFKGMKYTLTFTIKADAPADIDVFLQQAHDPYESIIFRTITAQRTAKTYVLENDLPARDDSLFLTFMCGGADKRTIYLDDISLLETKIK
jgi:hypothetical protein